MLVIKDLSVKKNNFKILQNVNLTIKRGEVHILLGLNGSGKTTLANSIMGLSGYKVIGGKILFNKKDIIKLNIVKRSKLGITLAWQEPARFKGISVKNYLSIGSRNMNKIKEALEIVGLSEEYLENEIDTLSGGERKKVELSSIILLKPKLVILDEIDSGIDILSLKSIFQAIKKMQVLNKTSFLLITHNPQVANLGDEASLLCHGTITFTGNPLKVKSYYKNYCKRGFKKSCILIKRDIKHKNTRT